MKIIKVLEGPEHTAARDAIYGCVALHPAYKRLSASLKPRAEELVGLPAGSPLYKNAWEMLVMACLAKNAAKRWEDWLLEAEMPIMADKAKRMQTCAPPGAVVESPKAKLITSCKQPSICPFCRYRRLLKLFDFVSKDVERGRDQHCLLGRWGDYFPRTLSQKAARSEAAKNINMLWRQYDIRRGFWTFDVVPFTKHSATVRIEVFGFVNEPQPSKRPRKRFKVVQDHHRVQRRPETILGLYRAICVLCPYPMKILSAKKEEVLRWAFAVEKRKIRSYGTKSSLRRHG